jgi:hypothetical protein
MPDTGREPIVETPMQARQAEAGPSILVLLLASTALAAIVMEVDAVQDGTSTLL